ncbi:hypothetical protein ACOXVJ_16515 [Pseudomonas knackmussii]|uniref:hypothetical protein n=1 Tax=Pseudomonas knackmussii TaxID=65741 RepID=UPI003BE7C087
MRLLALLALSLATMTTSAKEPTHAAIQEIEFDGCHFKIKDPLNGNLRLTKDGSPPLAVYTAQPNPNNYHSVDIEIIISCRTLKGLKAFTDLGFDRQNETWRLIPSTGDPENLAQVKLYPLKGHGTIGVASTDNQTTGEPNERVQGLAFCLTDQKQILCGTSDAIGYIAYPKESSLPQVLKLLESIEFIEPTQPTPGAP